MSSIDPTGLRYIQACLVNKAMTRKIAREHGFSPRDQVTVHTLPTGQKTSRYAGGSFKPVSQKAYRIQKNIALLKGEMFQTENNAELSRPEKARKLDDMRCRLKVLNCELTVEHANTPRVGIIVLEEDV